MLSSFASRVIIALFALVWVIGLSPKAEANEWTFEDSVFCQFVSQHTGDTKTMIELHHFNRLNQEKIKISAYSLNALMISMNSRAVFSIKSVMRNTNQSVAESAYTVFEANSCNELVREIRGERRS
ncbi:hypothetical protein [Salinivibrio phage CW02]|uniref:Uncharacterized protein n=1 Tax=Salinivibrio phage CW02 TaxID=1161935 RepID=H9D1J0_9CAUD|nr:hypothetical protein F490_gp05 [Salinivibrio phage CW02]AFE86232.1 hypothetical protein [Salinivibrio phage CW02]